MNTEPNQNEKGELKITRYDSFHHQQPDGFWCHFFEHQSIVNELRREVEELKKSHDCWVENANTFDKARMKAEARVKELEASHRNLYDSSSTKLEAMRREIDEVRNHPTSLALLQRCELAEAQRNVLRREIEELKEQHTQARADLKLMHNESDEQMEQINTLREQVRMLREALKWSNKRPRKHDYWYRNKTSWFPHGTITHFPNCSWGKLKGDEWAGPIPEPEEDKTNET